MFVLSVRLETVAAFMQGFNVASNGETLKGFREWLVLKVDYGNNLGWLGLFLEFAFPESSNPLKELEVADQQQLFKLLSDTFAAFWDERESNGGLEGILERHAAWVKSQDWYQEGRE